MNNKTLCPSLLLCLSLLAPLSCLGETAAAPYPLAHPPRLADYLPPPAPCWARRSPRNACR
ncbi:hypothetical protein ACRCQN_30750, partial [Pseudomonas aeruginosa]